MPVEDDLKTGKMAFAEWRFGEAELALRQALDQQPDLFEAKAYLARCLDARGDMETAVELYRQCLKAQPDNATVHLLLAQSLLTLGRYEEAWPAYEWRYNAKSGQPFPDIDAPKWKGEVLDGKTLLVIAEQGYGDVLQFIRFLPQVQALGGKVSLACSAPLARLLEGTAGIDHLFHDWHQAPPFDAYFPLSSLPGALGVTTDDLPGEVPYIEADPRLARRWAGRIQGGAGKRIGLCWAGRPTHPNDAFRSVPFDLVRDHLPAGNRYVSLQIGEAAKDAAGSVVQDFGTRVNDFADTAALIHNLDQVITVDTSVAHLAGAIGKPVWVLVPYVADWRWGREGETMPWYPTARIFRQSEPKKWEPPLAAIAAAL